MRRFTKVVLGVGAGLALAMAGTLTPASARAATQAQSNNWSGYDLGALQAGVTTFHSISATWTVPKATPHGTSTAEQDSAQWIGIGGGCIDSNCLATDSTLIQAGTSSDANVAPGNGDPYYMWWETIPGPSVEAFPVSPGDSVTVTISETAPEAWNIVMKDNTTGSSANGLANTVTPYPSDYSTAEWILETPVTASTSGAGLATMPDLSATAFDLATANGKPANLNSGVAMQLVDSNNNVVATPSGLDPDNDGFNVCVYSTTCSAPTSS